jgi:glucokinase
MGLTIGVDVGGTKIAAGVVDESGQVLSRARRDTPSHDPGATEDAIADLIAELRTGFEVEAVGLGAAGFVDADRARVVFAPNLAWRDEPLREAIERRTGLTAVVENDANAAAWAEARFGTGAGEKDVVVVTVGTGIGGGIVSGGQLFHGAHGFAAEIGHVIVEPGGPICGCGNHGCWEQVASGRAIDRLAGKAIAEDPSTPFAQRFERDPSRAQGFALTEAAIDGDATAIEIFRRIGSRLGEGIAGFVNVLDPDVVVVGGGAMDAGELLLEPARLRYAEAVEASEARPDVPIVAAELGTEAGAIGAAKLALEELDA